MSLITVNLNIDKGLDEYEKYEKESRKSSLCVLSNGCSLVLVCDVCELEWYL